MVRKAKLDEIELDLPSEEDEQISEEADGKEKRTTVGDEDNEESSGEEGRESHFSFLGERTGLTIFCILGCLLIIGVVWGTWHLVKKGKQPSSTAMEDIMDVKTQEQPLKILPTRQITFQDFMISLPEEAKYRLLEVSFTVEVVEDAEGVRKGDMGNDPGVRRQIVNAIQMRGRDLLLEKNSRALIKNDLLNLMIQILGENVVKNVYVTEFVFI